MVLEQRRRSFARVVRIEGGANGEGENLAGVHILDNHGSVVRVGPFHDVIEGPLRTELDIFVDGEDQILAGFGLVFAGAENLATSIHRGIHSARSAVQLRIEFLFQTAQAVVIHTHVAKHLRGNVVVRVESLEFLLRVDSLDVQGLHFGGGLGSDAARDPGKAVPICQTLGDLLFGGQIVIGVGVDNRRKRMSRSLNPCRALLVVNLAGNGIEGVRLHRHGQLLQVAVVEHAAARRNFKGAQLLFFSALHKLLVPNNLEPEKAAADDQRPDEKKEADDPEARSPEWQDAGCAGAVPTGSTC